MPEHSGPAPLITWKRVLVAMLAAAAVFGVVFAAAASLVVDGASLASGSDAVEACDNDFHFAFTVSDGEVTHVTIDDIASPCGGGELSITLTDESNAVVGSGSGTVASGSSSLTVPISPHPSVSSVYHEHVAIVGP
jgi:hypothetical protein